MWPLLPWPGCCIVRRMAFQLQPDESMSKGFQRLARKELKAAVGEIRRSQSPRDDAVHEARKHVKKVRAILQLIDDDDGDGLDRCEKRLRSVNRKLSELRDADVMMETLASLRKRYPHLFSEHTFALAQRMLSARKRDAWKAAERAGPGAGSINSLDAFAALRNAGSQPIAAVRLCSVASAPCTAAAARR